MKKPEERWPLVWGGHGHTPEDIEFSAWVLALSILGMGVLIVVAVLRHVLG